jgi:hypothetical protein
LLGDIERHPKVAGYPARTKKTTKSEKCTPSTNASSSLVVVSSPQGVDIKDNDLEPSEWVLGNGCVKGQKAAK